MQSTNFDLNAAGAGSPIDLDTAMEWTSAYQKGHQGQLQSCYFSADVLQTLIKQSGAQGIRIYLGNNGSGDCMILASATPEKDLIGSEYQLYEYGRYCPPYCSTDSPLNQ